MNSNPGGVGKIATMEDWWQLQSSAKLLLATLDKGGQLKSRIVSAEGLGIRHLQVFLMFLGMIVAYGIRVMLSVAIVAMVSPEKANPEFKVAQFFFCFLAPDAPFASPPGNFRSEASLYDDICFFNFAGNLLIVDHFF